MSTSSQVASHCGVFALSDSIDLRLKQQCNHSHDELCKQCESLHTTLHNISAERRGLVPYELCLAIQSWKCHLLRSTHQDQARLDVIDALDSETVFVVNDWAMKFLPQRYRESQTDWFGKRGISWHISVVYRQLERELQWQGFIHVIQSCSQGSIAVVTIMHHVLRTLKCKHPKINKTYFRLDNAGCYHFSRTILAFLEISRTGVKVVCVD